MLVINKLLLVWILTHYCPNPQSGDAQPGTVLALTIIPVHDDNIDFEYEPVSSTSLGKL